MRNFYLVADTVGVRDGVLTGDPDRDAELADVVVIVEDSDFVSDDVLEGDAGTNDLVDVRLPVAVRVFVSVIVFVWDEVRVPVAVFDDAGVFVRDFDEVGVPDRVVVGVGVIVRDLVEVGVPVWVSELVRDAVGELVPLFVADSAGVTVRTPDGVPLSVFVEVREDVVVAVLDSDLVSNPAAELVTVASCVGGMDVVAGSVVVGVLALSNDAEGDGVTLASATKAELPVLVDEIVPAGLRVPVDDSVGVPVGDRGGLADTDAGAVRVAVEVDVSVDAAEGAPDGDTAPVPVCVDDFVPVPLCEKAGVDDPVCVAVDVGETVDDGDPTPVMVDEGVPTPVADRLAPSDKLAAPVSV